MRSGIVAHGECWTLNTCEWTDTLVPFRSVDGVCSLSDILLETGDIPPRYFFEPGCLLGDTPPRRVKGTGAARSLTASVGGASETGRTWDLSGVNPTLNQCSAGSGTIGSSNQELFSQNGNGLVICTATGQANAETATDCCVNLTCNHEAPIVCRATQQANAETLVVCAHETGPGYWQGGDTAGTLRAEGENRPSRPSNIVCQYGNVAGTEDPNTSGYAHGIKTGVKLLSSLLNMDLRIINTNATDVKIQKVVLTTQNGTEQMFATAGNLIADAGTLTYDGTAVAQKMTSNVKGYNIKTEYRDPWFQATAAGKATSITLDCEDVETVKDGTKVTMLLLPADITNITTTGNQPVLKIYTNYGVVTVGGTDLAAGGGNQQTNCIYESDGNTYAAQNDNEALTDIVTYTTNYVVRTQLASQNSNKAYYYFKSGVSMTRVIKVDMQKAVIQNQHVKNTTELNNILNAAVAQKNADYTSSNPLNIYLDYNKAGQFTLTNFEGLDAFIEEYGDDALSFTIGNRTNEGSGSASTLSTIVVNTTSETVLKNIPGLPSTVTLTIPASSKINAIANGTNSNHVVIENAIINQTTITVPQYAEIELSSNANATTGARYTIHYTPGARINVNGLSATTYGTIDYTANNQNNLNKALNAGANYITVKDITSGFFAGGIDATNASLPAVQYGDGVTIVFDNCGNLSSTISTSANTAIEAKTIVLTNGTTYSNLTYADVENIIIESETATLGIPTDNSAPYTTKDDITGIWVKAGSTVTINNLDLSTATVQIDADATATIAGSIHQSAAPKHFYVFGTASFAGSNNQTDEEVFNFNTAGKISSIDRIAGNCLVTGALELATDLAYDNVAVGAKTAITTTNDDIIGLGFNKVYVTSDNQATNTENLQFITTRAINASDKTSWNGNFSNLGWGNTIPW